MDENKRQEAERNGRAYEGVDRLLGQLCRGCHTEQAVRDEAARIVWALGVVLEDIGCIPEGVSKATVLSEMALGTAPP